ncbi:MAG: hypothetical protein RI897_1426 [Verrucomicrobiota bacterium]
MVEVLVVAEEEGRAVDLGEDDVEVAVEVEVSVGGAASDDRGEEVCSGFGAGDGEEAGVGGGAVGVPEELGGLGVVLVGGDLFDIGFDVAVGGEEVEPAIEVVVEEEDAEREGHLAGGADALGEGFVGEEGGLVFGDVDGGHFVGEVTDGDAEGVVLVEVGGIDAHGAAGSAEGIERDTGGGADIAEGAVLLVAENEILDGVIGDDEV